MLIIPVIYTLSIMTIVVLLGLLITTIVDLFSKGEIYD